MTYIVVFLVLLANPRGAPSKQKTEERRQQTHETKQVIRLLNG